MAQEIVFTAQDGTVSIQIPANNVYVPNVQTLPSAGDFVTFEGEISGITVDEIIPAKGDFQSYTIKATHRLATIQEIAVRDMAILGVSEYFIVDNSVSRSTDNYFRGAWVHTNGIISIDMTKAVDVHKNELRYMREPEMAQLDIQYQRALETADQTKIAAVVTRKNALRDVTKDPAIAAATTPDQLKQAGLNTINGV